MNAPLSPAAAAAAAASSAAGMPASQASQPGLAPPAGAATLQLQLSLDDVNLLLEAVGALPFARVYALVGRIQSQAAAQLQGLQGGAGGQG